MTLAEAMRLRLRRARRHSRIVRRRVHGGLTHLATDLRASSDETRKDDEKSGEVSFLVIVRRRWSLEHAIESRSSFAALLRAFS